jgi:hypothetical protein
MIRITVLLGRGNWICMCALTSLEDKFCFWNIVFSGFQNVIRRTGPVMLSPVHHQHAFWSLRAPNIFIYVRASFFFFVYLYVRKLFFPPSPIYRSSLSRLFLLCFFLCLNIHPTSATTFCWSATCVQQYWFRIVKTSSRNG